MKWLFFGVLGLAPGHCSEKSEILQVRQDDQSPLGSGWNEVHCPPADLVQIRNIQRPNRSFTSVQMFHTHTPGRSRVNPERQEEEKADTNDGQKAKNSAGGGGERTDIQTRTNLHSETDLTKTGHTPKPHDTLQGGTGEELRTEWGTSW